MAVRTIFERGRGANGASSYAIGLPKDVLRRDGLLELLEDEDIENPLAGIKRTGPREYKVEILTERGEAEDPALAD